MPGSQPFDRSVPEALRWLDELAAELGVDRVGAHRALRAVLHAVRDRLLPATVVELAAGMPLLIRQLFFEGWTPNPSADEPDEDLVDRVSRELAAPNRPDFGPHATDAVLRLLERHVTRAPVAQALAG